MSDQYLEHYGVKGMKWGKTKREKYKPGQTSYVTPPNPIVRLGNTLFVDSSKALTSYVKGGAKVGQDVATKYQVEKVMRSVLPTKLTEKSFTQPYGIQIPFLSKKKAPQTTLKPSTSSTSSTPSAGSPQNSTKPATQTAPTASAPKKPTAQTVSKPSATSASSSNKSSGPAAWLTKSLKKVKPQSNMVSAKKQVRSILKEIGNTAASVLKGEPYTATGTKALQRMLSSSKKSK